MKNILTVILFCAGFVLNGQTINADKVNIKTNLKLNNVTVNSISNDTTLGSGSSTILPTEKAVKGHFDYVIDKDTILGTSKTKVPSQYAVKKYVDENGGGSAAGSSGQVQYNNSGAFGALDSFTVSANPDRVGIGVPTPTARLDIQGSGSTSATNALRVRNSSGTDLIIVDNSANVGLGTSNRLNGLSAINYLDIGTFASTPGGINVMGYSSLGGTSSGGWGAVGSNYFLNSANVLKRRFADPVSILTFESGGFQFKNAGSAAINSTIALTQLASINSGGFFALNVTTALAGFHNNINTTESTPSMLLSGTGFSGGTATTTKPTLLIEPTGTKSTGWSPSGTKLGINAESGFTGNLLDLEVNGTSHASIKTISGTVSNLAITGNIEAGSGKSIYWTNGGILRSETTSTISLYNSTASDFGRLNFGGTTSSFPALKRNGTGLEVMLADDSGFAASQSLYVRFGSGSPEGVVTAPIGAFYSRTDGGAGTSLYVKESGTGNTGWIAK